MSAPDITCAEAHDAEVKRVARSLGQALQEHDAVAPTVTEALTPSETEEVLKRLIQALQLASETLSSDVRGRIWIVHGTIGDAGTVQTCETRKELFDFIEKLRAQQNADLANEYYLHIFYGQRWQIQKGRVWKLWDGQAFEAIGDDDVADYLDGSGSMRSQATMEHALATSREPTARDIPTPSEWVQDAAEEAEAAAEELQTAPRVVGEDPPEPAAPPDTDPDITD